MSKPTPSVHLIMQSYPETKNPDRATELNNCLRLNLENDHVAAIYNFTEGPPTILPSDLQNHPKMHIIPDSPRLTYKMAIDFANSTPELYGKFVLILNSDIFLGANQGDWDKFTGYTYNITQNSTNSNTTHVSTPIHKSQRVPMALCLSRHEYNLDKDSTIPALYNNATTCVNYHWCQDSWGFIAPTIAEIPDIDFTVGNCPGCDNAIAERFYRVGYHVVNDPFRFPTYHYDWCRKLGKMTMIVTDATDNQIPEQRGSLYVSRTTNTNPYTLKYENSSNSTTVTPIFQEFLIGKKYANNQSEQLQFNTNIPSDLSALHFTSKYKNFETMITDANYPNNQIVVNVKRTDTNNGWTVPLKLCAYIKFNAAQLSKYITICDPTNEFSHVPDVLSECPRVQNESDADTPLIATFTQKQSIPVNYSLVVCTLLTKKCDYVALSPTKCKKVKSDSTGLFIHTDKMAANSIKMAGTSEFQNMLEITWVTGRSESR